MTDKVEISQEQADLFGASVQPAVDSLLATGNYVPTLYVHDGESMTFYTLGVQSSEGLYSMARQVLQQRAPGAVAYALLYDSTVETDDGPVDALIVESGDAEDDEAHEFARKYSRQDQSVAPKLARLGPASHLLK